jgi:hypothetical protein
MVQVFRAMLQAFRAVVQGSGPREWLSISADRRSALS